MSVASSSSTVPVALRFPKKAFDCVPSWGTLVKGRGVNICAGPPVGARGHNDHHWWSRDEYGREPQRERSAADVEPEEQIAGELGQAM